MSLKVPNEGEVELLARAINKNVTGNVVLHLYTNNHTNDETDTIASYTESTGSGYSAITLAGASWTVSTAAGTTTATHLQQTFTYTGAEPAIYGYYVTNLANTILLWVEEFTDGPYVVPSGGGSVKITPQIELD